MRALSAVAVALCIACSAGNDGGRPGPGGNGAPGAGGSGASGAGTSAAANAGGPATSGAGGASAGGSGAGGAGALNGGTTSLGGASTAGGTASGATSSGTSVLEACTDPNAIGPTPVRRLSRDEYANSVRDLFQVMLDPGDLPADELLGGVFTANIQNPMTSDNFTRYDTIGQSVGDQVAQNIAGLSGCGATDAACIKGYLAGKARQAFHGVLEPADQTLLENLYSTVAIDDPGVAASAVVAFILTSPRFLYVVDFGTPEGTVSRLSPGEIAGRMASFLWRSVPDADLLAAADGGGLADAAGMRTQATRMFGDPKAVPVLRGFVKQWLGLGAATGTDATARAIDAETGDVFTTLAQGTGTFADLFSTTQSQGTGDLAAFYGVTLQGDGKMTLPPERQGLLLRAAFMRSHIKGNLGSPTQRGKVVRIALLCDPVVPPGNVDMSVDEPMNGQTAQDVFQLHASEPACAGCHSLMDPIGFGFGTYGADGVYDTSLVASTAGSIVDGLTNDFTADFSNTTELMTALAGGTVPQQCFAIQTARFALGRLETTADACGLSDIWSAFQAGNLSLETLFVEVASSSLMRSRNLVEGGGACQ